MATRAEVSSTGVEVGPSLMDHVQRIDALNVFARAFPIWTKRHGKTPGFQIKGDRDGGVEINLLMPDGTASHEADDLFEILGQCQRLASLQAIVEELKNCEVDAATVERYVLEGETLMGRLYAKD